MTAHADLISLRVAKICAVVVGVVLRSQPWWSFATTSVRKRRNVATVDRRARRREKCSHVSITRFSRISIKRDADEKQRPVCASSNPASPGLLRSIDFYFKLKLVEDRFVKAVRSREVSDADVNMGQHWYPHLRAAVPNPSSCQHLLGRDHITDSAVLVGKRDFDLVDIVRPARVRRRERRPWNFRSDGRNLLTRQ